MLKISICQASYMSGEQSTWVRDEWLQKAKIKSRIEHCLGFESTDKGIRSAYGIKPSVEHGKTLDKRTIFQTTSKLLSPSAVRNWNAAAQLSTGELILLIADDLVPNQAWDIEIEKFILKKNINQGILKFTDDRCTRLKPCNSDTLMPRHPGILRKTYLAHGYVFDPIFYSTGPDLDLLVFGLSTGQLFDARAIKFHHSIGPIFDGRQKINCGCFEPREGNKSTHRTISQKRVHENHGQKISSILYSKWGLFGLILVYMSGINRLSNFILRSAPESKRQLPATIVIKTVHFYFLDKIKTTINLIKDNKWLEIKN